MDKLVEERRKIEQIPVYDEDGRIEYFAIPNYTLKEEFQTYNERNFHRVLIKVIQRINQETNSYLQISTQVALNRIIDINNKRNSALYEEIKDKSIDFVIFDLNTGKTICCIELNGKEHQENKQRRERDKLLEKMLKNIVKLFYIENNNYDENSIYKEIKEGV